MLLRHFQWWQGINFEIWTKINLLNTVLSFKQISREFQATSRWLSAENAILALSHKRMKMQKRTLCCETIECIVWKAIPRGEANRNLRYFGYLLWWPGFTRKFFFPFISCTYNKGMKQKWKASWLLNRVGNINYTGYAEL